MQIVFHPGGNILLTLCYDNSVHLWDKATGERIGQPLEFKGTVSTLLFNPDGKTFLTTCFDKTAQLWDTATGQPFGKPMPYDPYSTGVAAFHPKGRVFVIRNSGSTAQLRNAVTGEPIGQPIGGGAAVLSVTFSPNGNYVLTGEVDSARLWEAGTGKLRGPLSRPGRSSRPSVRTAG
jgi:WD40 repeat protein